MQSSKNPIAALFDSENGRRSIWGTRFWVLLILCLASCLIGVAQGAAAGVWTFGEPKLTLWSAVAKRSGDTALAGVRQPSGGAAFGAMPLLPCQYPAPSDSGAQSKSGVDAAALHGVPSAHRGQDKLPGVSGLDFLSAKNVQTPGVAQGATGAAAKPAVFEFLQPTNGAVFSAFSEIPMRLRVVVPDDVVLSAEVFANQEKIATVTACCAACACPQPEKGQEMILQIPIIPVRGQMPAGGQVWQGWKGASAGQIRLTAKGVSENGAVIEATPVTITVLDLRLNIIVDPDGSVRLVIPQGSMTEGGYDLEASEDLNSWKRLGSFSPGSMAAFYFDVPPAEARHQRFYRSVYIPRSTP